MHQLKDSFPEVFPIDDEFSVCSKSLDFEVVRPFDIVKSANIRTFVNIL